MDFPSKKRMIKFLSKAKRCPWCGTKKKKNIGFVMDYNFIMVTCLKCDYEGFYSKTPREAVKAWNRTR